MVQALCESTALGEMVLLTELKTAQKRLFPLAGNNAVLRTELVRVIYSDAALEGSTSGTAADFEDFFVSILRQDDHRTSPKIPRYELLMQIFIIQLMST